MTCRLRRRVLHSSALPVTDDDGLHSIFLSDGGDSGRVTACPPASSVRLTTGATPLLLVATSRRSSMGLEQALRLGERVVETLGINRDRAAVIARLDRQHQLSFLKTGDPNSWPPSQDSAAPWSASPRLGPCGDERRGPRR